MTVAETARALGVSANTVRRLCADGTLRCTRNSRGHRNIDQHSAAQYIAQLDAATAATSALTLPPTLRVVPAEPAMDLSEASMVTSQAAIDLPQAAMDMPEAVIADRSIDDNSTEFPWRMPTTVEIDSLRPVPTPQRDLADQLDDADDDDLQQLAIQLRAAEAASKRRQLKAQAESALHNTLQADIDAAVERHVEGAHPNAQADLRRQLEADHSRLDNDQWLTNAAQTAINTAHDEVLRKVAEARDRKNTQRWRDKRIQDIVTAVSAELPITSTELERVMRSALESVDSTVLASSTAYVTWIAHCAVCRDLGCPEPPQPSRGFHFTSLADDRNLGA